MTLNFSKHVVYVRIGEEIYRREALKNYTTGGIFVSWQEVIRNIPEKSKPDFRPVHEGDFLDALESRYNQEELLHERNSKYSA